MNSVLENITIGQVLLGLVLLTTFIQTVTTLRGTWRKWLRHEVQQVHDNVEQVKKSVRNVEYEVKPNGGNSLADKVNRIEVALRGMNRRLDKIESNRNE